MRFMLPRDRVIASTCGLSIGFKRGVFQLVPPAMYAEVLAAGGVAENEIPAEEMPPSVLSGDEKQAAMFKAFEAILLRGDSDDLTGGGTPKAKATAKEVGFAVTTAECNAAWLKYQNRELD